MTAVCASLGAAAVQHKTRQKCTNFFFFPPHTVDRSESSDEASAADLIRYPCNAFQKPQEDLKVNWRSAFGTTTLVFSDVSEARSPAAAHFNAAASEQGAHHKHSIRQRTTSPNYVSGGRRRQSAELSSGEPAASCSQPSKKARIDRGSFSGVGNAQNGAFDPV